MNSIEPVKEVTEDELEIVEGEDEDDEDEKKSDGSKESHDSFTSSQLALF